MEVRLEPNETFQAATDRILSSHGRDGLPSFFKDLPYHLGPSMTPVTLSKFKNSQLIRNPAYSVPSLVKTWPDFKDFEAGVQASYDIHLILRDMGEPFVILDSVDLLKDPEKAIAAWCKAVGIKFCKEALNWTPGSRESWLSVPEWASFYSSVAKSKRFEQKEVGPPPTVNESIARRIDGMMPLYRELEVNRLIC